MFYNLKHLIIDYLQKKRSLITLSVTKGIAKANGERIEVLVNSSGAKLGSGGSIGAAVVENPVEPERKDARNVCR